MIIYLMRHGEPTYRDTAAMKLPGMGAELGQLTAEGRAQAEAAAKDSRLQDVDLILASPYPRALQTAAIVSRAVDKPLDVAVGIFEWLPDADYAAVSHADIVASWNEYKANCGVHQPDDRFPNWETHAQMRARAKQAIAPFLAREDIGKLLIVCHGGIMRALMNQPSLDKIRYCEICELTSEMLEA